ncbi:MAG: Gfo/Idh/MocA family oxidoreductase [Bryobacterales bacterium]|nr:Gfo/Idh/MocA family oxidoreductase [Bryobacterales bacterium]
MDQQSPKFDGTGAPFSRRAALLAMATPLLAQDRKLRLGIVGGRFGATFQFHEHPNCVVEAVSDLVESRRAHLAKTYSCTKTYPSLTELLRDRQVEAVGLFTPAPDHVAHVLECLAAGKHVLCAVPAAMSLEECERLVEAVKRSGLTYMMAETSYYQQMTISARKFHQEGAFGRIYACESEYHHAGLDVLFRLDGKRTWRYGFPPMHYPTHNTAHLIGVTGERLTEVSCIGWGDGDPILKDNNYANPFWNQTALFRSERGTSFRVAVWWKGAHRGTERAQYFGDKMSLFFAHPNGTGPAIVRWSEGREKDSGGFERQGSVLEPYETPRWWATDLLPEPLRHDSGHEGSHTFLTHEFVDAVLRGRTPTVNVLEAVAYTAPGIVAHQSALKDGAQLRIPQFG